MMKRAVPAGDLYVGNTFEHDGDEFTLLYRGRSCLTRGGNIVIGHSELTGSTVCMSWDVIVLDTTERAWL